MKITASIVGGAHPRKNGLMTCSLVPEGTPRIPIEPQRKELWSEIKWDEGELRRIVTQLDGLCIKENSEEKMRVSLGHNDNSWTWRVAMAGQDDRGD